MSPRTLLGLSSALRTTVLLAAWGCAGDPVSPGPPFDPEPTPELTELGRWRYTGSVSGPAFSVELEGVLHILEKGVDSYGDPWLRVRWYVPPFHSEDDFLWWHASVDAYSTGVTASDNSLSGIHRFKYANKRFSCAVKYRDENYRWYPGGCSLVRIHE